MGRCPVSPLRVPRMLAYGIATIIGVAFLVLIVGFAIGPALS